ncbi:hypothetical protein Pmani_027008 [Petrolisthes manimaculis]|uniref:Uncharacterized protein n=1 Tax=Petrolisthes manimaculis TaxID=1843537 RepID=A0AAE1P525_9EUCA|nr:hypothetical protein Pmani_027008 [Petrolisthes manimaculis]
MQYEWQLLEHAGSLPLDVVRNILTSYVVSAIRTRSTGQRRLTGGDVQCPRCNTPRIANLLQSRLVSRPHHSHRTLRKIIKKQRKHPGKLTARERKRLLSFKHGENTMEVTCLLCHYKTRDNFSVPQKEVIKETLIVETKKKKKKKKKSSKEVNAGLLLSSKTPAEESSKSQSGNTSHTPKPTQDVVVVGGDQNTPSQTKPKSAKKHFEKLPRKGQKSFEKFPRKGQVVVDKPTNVSEKSHSDQTNNKSLPTSSPHATQTFTPSSDQLSFKAKKERHKKVSSLGNVIIKEVSKESSEKSQNASLEDFLGSLF